MATFSAICRCVFAVHHKYIHKYSKRHFDYGLVNSDFATSVSFRLCAVALGANE